MELENGEEVLKKTGKVLLSEEERYDSVTLTNNRVMFGEKEIRLRRIDDAQIKHSSAGLVMSLSLGVPGLICSTLLISGIPNPTEHPFMLGFGLLGLFLMSVAYHLFIGKTQLIINNSTICVGNGKHKALVFIASEINRIKKRGVGKPMRSLQ